MLSPRRSKYRKQMRDRMKGNATRGTKVAFGEFGLQATTVGWISSRQIEACRRAMSHEMKRTGKIWMDIFPDKPITKKPAEVRMGGGKGDIDEYVAAVKPGRMLFEVAGVPVETAREALRLAAHKLPVKTRFVVRGEQF